MGLYTICSVSGMRMQSRNLFRTTLEGETDLCYVCDHEWAGTAEHGDWRWSRNKSICCPRAGQDNPSGIFPQHAAVISHACRVTHKQHTVTDPRTQRSLPESQESVCYTAGDSLKSYKGLFIETILLGLSLSQTTHGAKYTDRPHLSISLTNNFKKRKET